MGSVMECVVEKERRIWPASNSQTTLAEEPPVIPDSDLGLSVVVNVFNNNWQVCRWSKHIHTYTHTIIRERERNFLTLGFTTVNTAGMT